MNVVEVVRSLLGRPPRRVDAQVEPRPPLPPPGELWPDDVDEDETRPDADADEDLW